MKNISVKQITKAIKILQQGGVIVFPTETTYGLAVDATNHKAANKIMKIKKRPLSSPFPLIVASFKMAEAYVEFSPLMRKLARQYWPGPLTIITKARKGTNLTKLACRSDGTIALRVSSHPLAKKLSQELLGPIISTSANLSGQPECYSIAAVHRQLDTQLLQPDYYLDEGALPRRKPSTIIKEVDGQIEIVRQGSIRL
ncbi:L-threonylcarbamoyladenylate synthase [Patescibacteria group bacterium]